MADGAKRNSAKVATPKSGGSPAPVLGDGVESLSKAIGARVKATTILGQTFEGTLFTADPILNVIAINTRAPTSASQPGDYQIISVSKLQAFNILSLESNGGFESAQPQIGPVDINFLRTREEKRIAQLKEEEQHKGKNVTEEGQAIYDAFRRINQPVRWHYQTIIVHDAVMINPPYGVDDCKAPQNKTAVLDRVKLTLQGERRKLHEQRQQAATTGPRKGG